MQFIFFLLGLFAIGCVLYGISAGVQIIQRGFSWLASSTDNSTAPFTEATNIPSMTKPLSCVDELQTLFLLYQNCALTCHEYEQCKNHVISRIAPADAKNSELRK